MLRDVHLTDETVDYTRVKDCLLQNCLGVWKPGVCIEWCGDVELRDEEVEKEFNDERRDVEQAVDAAASQQRQQPITDTIQVDVRVVIMLTGYEIAEADGRERDETIIQRVKVHPGTILRISGTS